MASAGAPLTLVAKVTRLRLSSRLMRWPGALHGYTVRGKIRVASLRSMNRTLFYKYLVTRGWRCARAAAGRAIGRCQGPAAAIAHKRASHVYKAASDAAVPLIFPNDEWTLRGIAIALFSVFALWAHRTGCSGH
ncbi:hypothetical protein EVAR_64479_1 [Eumeta japonica]|uniref:Uncharacterized protein n=1 Tax=Eumeta variegata TaxID=151549 RepID=A0A4C1ZK26_EUMVA|nr:hypothetical protein EVAR_64479_1 [Eumeta japonica]